MSGSERVKPSRVARWVRRLVVALVLFAVLTRLVLPWVLPGALDAAASLAGLEASYEEMHLRLLRGDLELWGLELRPERAEAEAAPAPPLMTVDYLGLDVDLTSLLRGEPRVRRASVDGLTLFLERDESGQWAWLEALAPLLEGSAAPRPEPDETDPSAPSLELPLELSALLASDVTVRLDDRALDPPLSRELHLDGRVVGLGGEGQTGHLEGSARCAELLAGARVEGVVSTGPDELALDLDFDVGGLELKVLEPYLVAQGLRPTAEDTDAQGHARLAVRRSASNPLGLALSLELSGLAWEVDGVEELALDSLQLDVPGLGAEVLHFGALQVAGVRGRAAITEYGALAFAGFELVDPPGEGVQAAAPALPDEAAEEEFDATPEPGGESASTTLALDEAHAREVRLLFEDRSVTPVARLDLNVDDARLSGFAYSSAGPATRANLQCAARLPGLVGALRLDGGVTVSPDALDADAELALIGLEATAIEGYLAPLGLRSEYADGSLRARFAARVGWSGEGLSVGAGVTELRLAPTPTAEPVLELGAAVVRGLALHPDGGVSLEEASIAGLRTGAVRDADGSLSVLGMRVGRSTPGSEGPQSESPQGAAKSGGSSPSEPASLPPRIEVSSLRWTDTYIEFVDRGREEPFVQALDQLEASLTGLVLGGEGERAPAEVRLSASAGELARSVELGGEFLTQPGVLDARGKLELRAQGLSLVPLAPYLAELEFEPVLDDGALQVGLSAELEQREGRLTVGLGLSEVSLTQGDELLAGLTALDLVGLTVEDDELRVPRLVVTRPMLGATLEESGALRLLGLRVLPRVPEGGGPARLPRVHELIDLAAVEALISSVALGEGPAVRLGDLDLEMAGFGWHDLTVEPEVHARASVDAALDDFVLGREADPATFSASLRVAETIESLALRGELLIAPSRVAARGELRGEGLRGGALVGYLPPGVTVELEGGRLRADFEARAEELEPGEYTAAANLERVELGEAGAQRPAFALREVGAELERFSERDNRLALGDVVARGMELEVAREGGEVLRALGLRVDLAELAAAAPPEALPAEEPSITDRAGTARELEEREVLPRIELGGLDLELARLSVSDDALAGGREVDLSFWARTEARQVLLDDQPQELPPLELALGAGLPPVVGEVEVRLVAEPFVAEPRLRVQARAGGLDAVGLCQLFPRLEEHVDGSAMRDGEVTGDVDVVLRARRRGPTDYDLRRGFGLELETGEIALRAEPGGEVLGGLGGLRADVRRIEPATGRVHVSELELLDPRGSIVREEGGLRVAGVLIKLPESTEVEGGQAVPASAPAAEPSVPQSPVVAEEEPDLRIDRFYITGMDCVLADVVSVPPMRLPLSDIDLEVRGLSTRALAQGRPVRFSTFASAGEIPLPKRDDRGRLVELPEGEESAWPVGHYAVEERPAFEEFSLSGELRTQPERTGHAKIELRGMELLNYSGTSQEFGFQIEDGVMDSSIHMKLRERGLSVDSTTTFTWLSMSEGANGPLRSLLSLPAPIDTVIFMTRNGSGENTIPLSFYVPASGLSVPALAAAATATLTQVIAASVARSPFRLVGGALDFAGLGSDEPVARTLESSEFQFDPGAARARVGQAEKLGELLEKLRRDDSLLLVVQHELGGGDLLRCEALANPDLETCREFAAGLRLTKARLWKERELVASQVRAEYAMGEIDRAESLAVELHALDAELGRTESALDQVYQLLRPGAERRRDKRTKKACLDLARLRLSIAKARLLYELGPEYAGRIDIRRPRFVPSDDPRAGGVVVLTPKRR